MKSSGTMRFSKHLFICTHEREDKGRRSCGEACGLDLVKAFKKEIKERGLQDTIRAQRSGCLDACDYGPSAVVYPDGVFYGNLRLEDVKEIVEEHLVKGIPVERCITRFGKMSES